VVPVGRSKVSLGHWPALPWDALKSCHRRPILYTGPSPRGVAEVPLLIGLVLMDSSLY
jgi:hypothetical protein